MKLYKAIKKVFEDLGLSSMESNLFINALADYEAFQEILADKNTRTRIGRLLKLTGCGSIVTFASYKKTQEKAHGQIETREYYQTEKINQLEQKKDWKGLKSIIMEKKTLEKDGEHGEQKKEEYRHFIL